MGPIKQSVQFSNYPELFQNINHMGLLVVHASKLITFNNTSQKLI